MPTSLDSLSLQRMLLRVTGGIGGTWTPALAVLDDASLKSRETRELADGRTLVITSRVTVSSYGLTDKPSYFLTMLRELSVAAPGASIDGFRATRMSSAVSHDCDPLDADSVLVAIDKCVEQIDAECHSLRVAMEDAHV